VNYVRKFVAMLLMLIPAVQAQTAITVYGQWTGVTKSPSTGNELQIQVRISEAGGTWRYVTPAAASKAGPCLGREFPLSIKSLPNAKMLFGVDGPSVIMGCPSFAVTLELTDEQTLTGAFGDGRPVVLKKR
jgi:hypothetical protein